MQPQFTEADMRTELPIVKTAYVVRVLPELFYHIIGKSSARVHRLRKLISAHTREQPCHSLCS